MGLIEIVLRLVCLLLIVGVVLWAINKIRPIDPDIKNIINVVVLAVVGIGVVLWLLDVFTGGHGFYNPRIGP
jgi:hypothetical protein